MWGRWCSLSPEDSWGHDCQGSLHPQPSADNVIVQACLIRPDGSYEYAYNVTNVEYTEFGRLGVPDECLEGSQFSRYPANTNVLYVGLKVGLHACTSRSVSVVH